jgi:hypothetical protein
LCRLEQLWVIFSTTTESQHPNWTNWGLFAQLLTIVPGEGYLVAYAYEFGYTSYFGVPPDLIAPQPTLVFIAVASVLTVLLFIFGLMSAAYPVVIKFPRVVLLRVVLFMLLLSPIVVLVALGLGLKLWPILLSDALIAFLYLGLPLFTRRER